MFGKIETLNINFLLKGLVVWVGGKIYHRNIPFANHKFCDSIRGNV